MKKQKSFALLLMASALMTGCASVKVYSDAGLKHETGVRFYSVKPYLLVEYQADKDNKIKSTVLFLPDLSTPQFARVRPGIGKSDLKLGLKNGILESYGGVVDSKVTDAFEAFANMLSKSAYAVQTLSSPTPPYEGEADDKEPPFRLYEIIITPEETLLKEAKL